MLEPTSKQIPDKFNTNLYKTDTLPKFNFLPPLSNLFFDAAEKCRKGLRRQTALFVVLHLIKKSIA